MSRYERIEATLSAAFSPVALEIVDDSGQHAGHAARNGMTPNAETHFSVKMLASAFAGLSRVARQRAVNEALREEFACGLHALQLNLRAPGE